MSNHALFFGAPPPHQHHSHPSHSNHSNHSHNHHGGRSRRAPRMSSAAHHHKQQQQQQQQQQMRIARSQRDILEAAAVSAYRQNFEAARSFDLEDDELFCPFSLLTEDDLTSIHSSGSDRSSLSSGSPEQSPLQHQLQPTPAFMLPASTYLQSLATSASTKIHQPIAQRSGKAIPIVNPATRTVASPPPSVSPARQMAGRVW